MAYNWANWRPLTPTSFNWSTIPVSQGGTAPEPAYMNWSTVPVELGGTLQGTRLDLDPGELSPDWGAWNQEVAARQTAVRDAAAREATTASVYGGQTGLQRMFYQDNPQVAYAKYLEHLGGPNSPFGQYAAKQYGRINNQYLAASAQNPDLQATDFYAGLGPRLKTEFANLSAEQRGERPERFITPSRITW